MTGSSHKVKFVVPGDPVAKGRPRARVMGGFAKFYTPAKTKEYEEKVALWANRAMNGSAPLEGPVSVVLIEIFQFPKSRTKRDREAMRRGEIPCLKNVDVDNVAKAVLDGINGVAFVDDKQITRLVCEKRWGDVGRVLVKVEPAS